MFFHSFRTNLLLFSVLSSALKLLQKLNSEIAIIGGCFNCFKGDNIKMNNYSTVGARRVQEGPYKLARESEPPMMQPQMNRSRESARVGKEVPGGAARPLEAYQPAFHRTDSSNGQNPPRYSMVE